MEVTKAYEFVYEPPQLDDVVYVCKDLQRLMDEAPDADLICGVYGVVDTVQGPQLFEVEEGYDGEPCLTRRFMHKKSYFEFHKNHKIIEL